MKRFFGKTIFFGENMFFSENIFLALNCFAFHYITSKCSGLFSLYLVARAVKCYAPQNQAGLHKTRLGSTKPNWAPQNQTGLHQTRLGSTKPNWAPQNQTGLHKTRLGSTKPNCHLSRTLGLTLPTRMAGKALMLGYFRNCLVIFNRPGVAGAVL